MQRCCPQSHRDCVVFPTCMVLDILTSLCLTVGLYKIITPISSSAFIRRNATCLHCPYELMPTH